ncbi:RTA1-like protein [Crassisporium funariophilum]|nr:RTA1-like protein [Crassisporium funariophilum]
MSSNNGTAPLTIFELSPYHYVPTRSVAYIFLVLFFISTFAHVIQSVKYRMWWLIPTACFCGVLELTGWGARMWSTNDPFNPTPFEIQITATIIAPTPLIAANFVILGKIIERLGPAYSRLTPKMYTAIFCTCDVISLVTQAAGGTLATSKRASTSNLGTNIMLGGIVFQLAILILYACCGVEYYVRYFKERPIRSKMDTQRGRYTTKLRRLTYGLVISTTCLFVRAIYRTVELADGWNGKVISNQLLFNLFDGAMVVIAIYTLNIAHPGVMLANPEDFTVKFKKESA